MSDRVDTFSELLHPSSLFILFFPFFCSHLLICLPYFSLTNLIHFLSPWAQYREVGYYVHPVLNFFALLHRDVTGPRAQLLSVLSL